MCRRRYYVASPVGQERRTMDKHSLDTLSHKGKDPDATSGEKLELAIKVVELIDDVVKLSALKRRQLSRD